MKTTLPRFSLLAATSCLAILAGCSDNGESLRSAELKGQAEALQARLIFEQGRKSGAKEAEEAIGAAQTTRIFDLGDGRVTIVTNGSSVTVSGGVVRVSNGGIVTVSGLDGNEPDELRRFPRVRNSCSLFPPNIP